MMCVSDPRATSRTRGCRSIRPCTTSSGAAPLVLVIMSDASYKFLCDSYANGEYAVNIDLDEEERRAITQVHDDNVAILGMTALDPAGVLSHAADSLAELRTSVKGECRKVFAIGRELRFVLCVQQQGRVGAVDARIDARTALDIDRFLNRRYGRTLIQHVKSGHEITVDGSIKMDHSNGRVYVAVVRVGPHYAKVGSLSRLQELRRAELARCGVDPSRLADDFEHHLAYSPAMPWPQKLKKIVVISPRGSQGANDLLGQLQKSRAFTCVEDRGVMFQGRGAADSIVNALARHSASDADIVVLARGGGRIETLSPFDEFEVAKAIVESETPVFTAIGHKDDMTLADRAAAASFDVPASAGKALCARPFKVDEQNLKKAKRATVVANAIKPKADVVEGAVYRELVQRCAHLNTALAQVQREYSNCLNMYHVQLHRNGFQRIQLRSRAIASALLVASFVGGFALAEGFWVSTSGWLAVAFGVAMSVYIAKGPARALKVPSRLHNSTPDLWYAAAEKVRTPREFSRLWPYWPKP